MLNGQPLSAVQAARNPGYAGTPTQQVFFGERGSQSFKGFALVDLAVTYGVPVWRSAQPWIKFEMFNVLNNQKLIAWDTTITADAASARDEFGLPTGYVRRPALRPGHVQRALSDAARRHRRRPDVRLRGRIQVLSLSPQR